VVEVFETARTHSDARLVEQCRNGDDSAFDELVRRYKDRVFNVVCRFLGNREDALDVVQEVFVRAYRSIGGFQGRSKVYTWLYSIAANLARNRLRDQSRKGRDCAVSLEGLEAEAPGIAQRAATADPTPRKALERKELEEALQQCLSELQDHYRLAFVLRTIEDLSYDEIAEVMGCPTGTVKSRLNHARRMLRERLGQLEVL